MDVVLAFVGKGGSKVTTDHKHLKDNKGFGLDVEGNNNMDLQEDLKAFQPGLQGQQAPAQQSMSLDLGPVRYRTQEELEEATQWLNRWRGGPEMDLRTPGDIVRHAIAMERARPGLQPGGNPTPPPARTVDPPQREVPAPRQQDQQPGGGEGESLLQRILRLAGAGPICGGTPPSTPRVH